MSTSIFGMWLSICKLLHPRSILIGDFNSHDPDDRTGIVFISIIPDFLIFLLPLLETRLGETGIDNLVNDDSDYYPDSILEDFIPFQKL